MTHLIDSFKDCAQEAGEILYLTPTRLDRKFQLSDFLENELNDGDDAEAVVTKALTYFCEESTPRDQIFQWAVLTVGVFLQACYNRSGDFPQQALTDLVTLLNRDATEQQIRQWIRSHFG